MSGEDRPTLPSFLTGRSQPIDIGIDASNLSRGVGEGDGANMNDSHTRNLPMSPLGRAGDSPSRRRQGMVRWCSTGSMSQKHRATPIMPFFYNRRSNEDLMYILVVSNPRCNLQNVNRLVEEITHRFECVDLVLLTGNLSNLSEEDAKVPSLVSSSEADMSAVLSALENIQCRVAYLSGPEDPPSSQPHGRDIGPRLTPHSCNMHNRCVRIAPDLVLSGYALAPTSAQMSKGTGRGRRGSQSLAGPWNNQGMPGGGRVCSSLLESAMMGAAADHAAPASMSLDSIATESMSESSEDAPRRRSVDFLGRHLQGDALPDTRTSPRPISPVSQQDSDSGPPSSSTPDLSSSPSFRAPSIANWTAADMLGWLISESNDDPPPGSKGKKNLGDDVVRKGDQLIVMTHHIPKEGDQGDCSDMHDLMSRDDLKDKIVLHLVPGTDGEEGCVTSVGEQRIVASSQSLSRGGYGLLTLARVDGKWTLRDSKFDVLPLVGERGYTGVPADKPDW